MVRSQKLREQIGSQKISRLGKQPNFQLISLFLEAVWMATFHVFLSELMKQWNFEKIQASFVAQVFSNKIIFWVQFENRFFLNFSFASFHCLQALTGCLEKLKISMKRVGL